MIAPRGRLPGAVVHRHGANHGPARSKGDGADPHALLRRRHGLPEGGVSALDLGMPFLEPTPLQFVFLPEGRDLTTWRAAARAKPWPLSPSRLH
jgi:hypothetical protein